jgi:hypothetical protein
MFRLLLAALLLLPLATPALADNDYKPDDVIAVQLSTEGWVTTKTARVVIQVNASVSGDAAGTTRDAMIKSVNALAQADWRLISFNRNPSEAGLENWFAQFEARLPEKDLSGMNEKTKKASKPGMQLTVSEVDFTPTLAENEAVRSSLRKAIMDMATAELKSIQASFPDRNYRIANIAFGGGGGGYNPMVAQAMAPRAMMMKGAQVMSEAEDSMTNSAGVQTAQRIQETAYVSFAAVAPVAAK